MTVTAMRLSRAYEDPAQVAFRRLATAVEKYWVTKRAAPAAVEALECLGGNGYVEESMMPQLYRASSASWRRNPRLCRRSWPSAT
jgi:putative acyl-CoA dehydrogenase